MGSVLSLSNKRNRSNETLEIPNSRPNKRIKLSQIEDYDPNPRLIPNLPDEISLQILARLPRIHYLKAKLVNRTWKSTIISNELYQLRKELRVNEEWVYILTKTGPNKLYWYGLDPISDKWQRLPPMPYIMNEELTNRRRGFTGSRMWNVIGSTIRIADFVKGWFFRNNGSDLLPFCGCAVSSANGCLYVLGGFSKSLALSCVWCYDPRSNTWREVTSMTAGRAFCKTGYLNGKIYVVGGVSRGRNGILHPLRSAEVFDPETGEWSELSPMPFVKAQVLPPAFLADVLKPVATGMTCHDQRLYVTQSLYSWPFFFDIGGEVYDPASDTWQQMPAGMGQGWPAKQAGTKLGVVVNGDLYALEPSSNLEGGRIKRYDPQEDTWQVTIGRVRIRDFTDSEAPFLLTGFHGGLHVITKDGDDRILVLRLILENRVEESGDSLLSSEREEEEGLDLWRVVSVKNFGSAELVSCQVIDL